MKKLILFIALGGMVLSANAQLQIAENGQVKIGTASMILID